MRNPMVFKPVVTEKSLRLAGEGVYTFAVPKQANKLTVAAAIEAAYKVHVVSVNITKLPGKAKRRGRVTGHTKALTKALVRLKSGESIPGYELTVPVEDTAETKQDSKQAEITAKATKEKETA